MSRNDVILCVPDLHCPWIHKEKVAKMLALIPEIKPTHVVCLGDSYDMHSFSKFPRSLNILTPEDEIVQARECMEEIWAAINRSAKKAKKYQLKGNHSTRINKRLMEKFPELESLLNINHLWEFPGVTTISDDKMELVINDISFIHGHFTKLGDHVKQMNRSIICGHSHRLGLFYLNRDDKTLFEMNCGYLASPYAKPLIYRPMKRFFDWTHGFGVVDKLGPRIIHL